MKIMRQNNLRKAKMTKEFVLVAAFAFAIFIMGLAYYSSFINSDIPVSAVKDGGRDSRNRADTKNVRTSLAKAKNEGNRYDGGHFDSRIIENVGTSLAKAKNEGNENRADTKNVRTSLAKAKNEGNEFVIETYQMDDIVSNEIKRGGWEPQTVTALNQLFRDYSMKHEIPLSDLTFIDIGANIGWISMNMAALGVKVLAFEPMEENIRLLKKTLNNIVNIESGVSGRITLYEHGLGTKEETCFLYSDNHNFGDGHVKCVELGNLVIPAQYTTRGSIRVKRLDDVILDTEGLHIAAIKMDTEGYEGNVLGGGTKLLLGGSVNALITEFQPAWLVEKGSDPVVFMKKMSSAGYRVKKNGGEYMNQSEMMDMSNFGNNDLTFHSAELISEYGVEVISEKDPEEENY
eukprot:CAMPEP_0197827868 /NCGR_PEP_ID=MMETSP1437-20131217/4557_1 /TAXON_ID=49252 ORGANISM="Eucampia antarctica, Strain CCMP1452" /NCGR_SAMPLE_ID=MMETSP1437 /ASSEMBLY_ACC=CAM_ASM_001096 /LENGTH=402 /DNA_ID=CAMNT_0043428877 /DNA_START=144 /DNA_END=1352 /DNA_ORIENTATION=+